MNEQPCACIYVDDAETCEFYNERYSVARIEHKCHECGRVIPRGERYEVVTGKWDSRLDTFKTCLDCLSIRNSFFCNGFLFGGLWEMLSEHINEMRGEIASECLVKLTPAAKAKVCTLIEDAWPEEGADDDKDD